MKQNTLYDILDDLEIEKKKIGEQLNFIKRILLEKGTPEEFIICDPNYATAMGRDVSLDYAINTVKIYIKYQ